VRSDGGGSDPEHEQIHIWNVTRGTRLVTYALRGEPNSASSAINGAAAHHASPGDLVILATFAELEANEARGWKPPSSLSTRKTASSMPPCVRSRPPTTHRASLTRSLLFDRNHVRLRAPVELSTSMKYSAPG